MAGNNVKIVIVGGSVTGLTLANVLERLDIDYVLLEAYEKLAPQLGASLALFPNGLRVMDQLGCYEAFMKDIAPVDRVNVRLEGEPLLSYDGFGSQFLKRHGHRMAFNERKTLLDILYANLKDKSKILTKKRAVKVEPLTPGVRVHTQDGDSFTGDLLIGADGVHSTIRKEMWRLGHELSPGYFPKDDELKDKPIQYRAVFTICKPNPRYPSGHVHTSLHKGHSYLSSNGPNDRIYLFIFEKLEKDVTFGTAPRYTKEDEEKFVSKYRHEVLYNDVTVGELWDGRTNSGMLPLEEFVCDRWYFGRTLILGDAAHKLNPLTGQGGNNAIEDVAAFVNALTSKLDTVSGSLSEADVTAIFAATEDARKERATLAVDAAHSAQKGTALERPGTAKVVRLMAPYLPRDVRGEGWTKLFVNTEKVNKLPEPNTRHFVPFKDELPAAPLKKSTLPRLAAAAAFAGLYYLGLNALRLPVFPATFSFLGEPFKTVYTGRAGLDRLLTILVKFFSGAVASTDPGARLQALYLLSMLTPTIAIWTIESRRRGNTQNFLGYLLTWPNVFTTLGQLKGIAQIGPLYGLLSLFATNNVFFQRTSGRPVDAASAKAVLPALAVGYIVPSILMMTPYKNVSVWQSCIAAWQVAPLLVSPLTSLFASAIRWFEGPKKPDPKELDQLSNDDVPHLLSTYSFTLWSTATVHLATLAYIAVSPGMSFSSVFFNLQSPFGPLKGDAVEGISSFFKYDLIGYVGYMLVSSLYSVYEMRRLGYVTTAEAGRAALAVVGSVPLLGPGAMMAGTWAWKERAISTLSKW
ncbi:FAD binding domain-containing protein [Thozetella sp. PMI_491]|nr:FAD binding domain-containing protein [Thozetella sp. PMI_491]